jgi:hypothetical protein
MGILTRNNKKKGKHNSGTKNMKKKTRIYYKKSNRKTHKKKGGVGFTIKKDAFQDKDYQWLNRNILLDLLPYNNYQKTIDYENESYHGIVSKINYIINILNTNIDKEFKNMFEQIVRSYQNDFDSKYNSTILNKKTENSDLLENLIILNNNYKLLFLNLYSFFLIKKDVLLLIEVINTQLETISNIDEDIKLKIIDKKAEYFAHWETSLPKLKDRLFFNNINNTDNNHNYVINNKIHDLLTKIVNNQNGNNQNEILANQKALELEYVYIYIQLLKEIFLNNKLYSFIDVAINNVDLYKSFYDKSTLLFNRYFWDVAESVLNILEQSARLMSDYITKIYYYMVNNLNETYELRLRKYLEDYKLELEFYIRSIKPKYYYGINNKIIEFIQLFINHYNNILNNPDYLKDDPSQHLFENNLNDYINKYIDNLKQTLKTYSTNKSINNTEYYDDDLYIYNNIIEEKEDNEEKKDDYKEKNELDKTISNEIKYKKKELNELDEIISKKIKTNNFNELSNFISNERKQKPKDNYNSITDEIEKILKTHQARVKKEKIKFNLNQFLLNKIRELNIFLDSDSSNKYRVPESYSDDSNELDFKIKWELN